MTHCSHAQLNLLVNGFWVEQDRSKAKAEPTVKRNCGLNKRSPSRKCCSLVFCSAWYILLSESLYIHIEMVLALQVLIDSWKIEGYGAAKKCCVYNKIFARNYEMLRDLLSVSVKLCNTFDNICSDGSTLEVVSSVAAKYVWSEVCGSQYESRNHRRRHFLQLLSRRASSYKLPRAHISCSVSFGCRGQQFMWRHTHTVTFNEWVNCLPKSSIVPAPLLLRDLDNI